MLASSVAACTQIVPSLAPPASVDSTNSASQVSAVPTAGLPALTAPTRTPSGPKTATVALGSITQTSTLDGFVAAQNEQPVFYNGRGNVVDVKVKAGDAVKQGDELLELEAPHHMWAQDVAHELEQAQARVEADKQDLAKAQAADAVQQQQAAARAASAAAQQQQAITDATSQLKRAQDNLTRVQAGAAQADRQAAQNGVSVAQTALQQAQTAYGTVAAGPDANAVRAATRDLTNAQSAQAKAQSDLDALTRGPDPAAVRDAQATLQRTQTQLQIAQASKPDPKLDPSVAKLQHDQAVQDAQLAVDNASAALGKLKLPPPDADVQAAKQHVSDTNDALAAAQDHLTQVQSGPDQAGLDAAQATVDKANQNVLAAQAKLAEVTSHPTPSELGDAQDQVRKAQNALDQARSGPPQTTDPNANNVDLSKLQNTLNEDQATVDGLQQTLDATKLPSPIDGVVVSVRVKAGQSITSEKPAFTIAPAAPPVVRADLDDSQVTYLSVGQSAIVSVDPDSGVTTMTPSKVDATVMSVTPASSDGSKSASAQFQVQWPDGAAPPKFGVPVQVQLTLQQKDGVLVVPTSALHQAGANTTVQVQNGTLRKLVNVQVGIRTDASAEIVSGLTEGQVVILSSI
jgi:multidrug resistance efflux pump